MESPLCRPHILVVDDDRDIRLLIRDYLDEHGLRVTSVAGGPAMLKTLRETHVDLIVLDVMLPGPSGLTLCREIRASSQVPIVLVTALAEVGERIAGIETGADDYLAKPFNPRELLSRVMAILRRFKGLTRDPLTSGLRGYRFGDWRLDIVHREVTHADGRTRTLSGAEFRLLALLLAHPTGVFSRIRLMEILRGRELDPHDRSIDVRICRLRQILDDRERASPLIKTVHGKGYAIGVAVAQE